MPLCSYSSVIHLVSRRPATAFTRNEDTGESTLSTHDDVFVIGSDGGDVRQLTPDKDGRSLGQPTWSLDGRQLAYEPAESVQSAVPSRYGDLSLSAMTDLGVSSSDARPGLRSGLVTRTDGRSSSSRRESADAGWRTRRLVIDLDTGAERQLRRRHRVSSRPARPGRPTARGLRFAVRLTRRTTVWRASTSMKRDGPGNGRSSRTSCSPMRGTAWPGARRQDDRVRDVVVDRMHLDLAARCRQRLGPTSDLLHAPARGDRGACLAACTWHRRLSQDFNYCSAPQWVDQQRLSPDELISLAREQVESATDFTVAVEEEFAILDPEYLDSPIGRGRRRRRPAGRLSRRPRRRADASEVESRRGSRSRRGRAGGDRRAAASSGPRRADGPPARSDGNASVGRTGRSSGSSTPHYRRNDQLLRYVVWRNNTFGLARPRRDQRARPRDRGHAGLRLPPSSSRSRRARRSSRGQQRAPLARTHLHALLPSLWRARRLRVVGRVRGFVRFLYDTARSPSTRSCGGRRPISRSRRSDPDLDGSPRCPRRSRSQLSRPRSPPGSPTRRRGRARRAAASSLHRGDFWRAIRYGRPGELINFERREAIPAPAARGAHGLVLPVAEEIGAAPSLGAARRKPLERQIERFESGAQLEEIYAEQVRATEAIGG